MRLRIIIPLALILALVPFAGAARAEAGLLRQADEAPLIMLIDGDFWAWSEVPARFDQLTTSGHNARPALSPDGTRLAYTSVAAIAVAALDQPGGIGDADPPTDIWVLDLASGEGRLAAGQPEGASFMAEGAPDNYIVRSAPAWSPDGSMLVWMEHSAAEDAYRLVTYDLDGGSLKTIAPDLPPQAGVPGVTDPRWGSGGIALHLTIFDETIDRFEEAFLIYDVNGNLLADARQPAGEGGAVVDLLWAEVGGQDYLAAVYSGGTGLLIEPATGATQPADAPPHIYSRALGAASPTVYFRPRFDAESGLRFGWWYLPAAQMTPSQLPFEGRAGQIALSPTGDTVAYVGDEGVYIWRDGHTGKIAGTEEAGGDPQASVVWGVTAWRVMAAPVSGPVTEPAAPPTDAPADEPVGEPIPTPTVDPTFSCPGAPAPRLIVGERGRVTPGTPNRLRQEPAGRYLRDIPGGATFDVLEGPQCVNGFVWWRVRYGSVEGWTAEGQGESYWLEPVR